MKRFVRNILMLFVVLYPLVLTGYTTMNYLIFSPTKESFNKNEVVYDEGIKYVEKEFFEENYLNYKGIKINYEENKEGKNIINSDIKADIFELNTSIWMIMDVFDAAEKKLGFEKENWLDLKVELCSCNLWLNGKALGFYAPYKNQITLPVNTKYTSKGYKSVVAHEIAHYLFENKLTYKQKKEYYNKYISDKELSFSEKLELTSFYRADKYTKETKEKVWKDLLEEQIVEDIKSVFAEEKNNRALERDTPILAQEELRRMIIESKDRNNTMR